MKKQIKFLFIILLLFGLTNTANSQASFRKKGKLKGVVYENKDYGAIGYVSKKKYVEGQELTFLKNLDFYSLTNYGFSDTIVSGKYYCSDNGTSYIKGIWKRNFNYGYKITILKGTFKVTNTKTGIGITANKKEGVKLKILIDDLLYFKTTRENTVTDHKDTYVLEKLPDNNYSLIIKYKGITLDATMPFVVEQNINSYYLDNYIKKSKQAKLSFKNGDVFIGTVKEKSLLPAYSYFKADYAPDCGEYRYATGEVCTGTFEYNNYYHQFYLVKGITEFTDGSLGKDHWIKQYNLTSRETERIYRTSKSLTVRRNMAKEIYEEKEKKLLEKKIAQDQSKEEEFQKQKALGIKLIAKYGEHFGNQIIKGKFVLGMTKQMVNEIIPKKFFKISITGNEYVETETWEFDERKMLLEMRKEKGEDGGKLALGYLLIQRLGYNLSSEIPMIIFTDGRITSILYF